MNLILTRLQHNFDFHMDHNSDTGTNIIGSIFNSDKVFFKEFLNGRPAVLSAGAPVLAFLSNSVGSA